jgi:uncharacterized protein (DUF58 family)
VSSSTPNQDLLDPHTLAHIEDYNLLGRMIAQGIYSGLHKSIRHGRGTEFFQYRNYSPGEDLKFVDWKVYARSNHLYTKTFEEETNTHIYLIIDTSASMSYTGSRSPCSKLRYATMAAASLAHLANRQGDGVGLFAYGEQIHEWIEPRTGRDHLQNIYHALDRLKPSGKSEHQRALPSLVDRLPGRGLVIMFSDMLEAEEELPDLLQFSQSSRYDCIAFQILDPDEMDLPYDEPLEFSAMEEQRLIPTFPETIRSEYQKNMTGFQEKLAANLAASGVHTFPIQTNQSLGIALSYYLSQRERRS